jgi:pyrroline-5-carboxylate reductase
MTRSSVDSPAHVLHDKQIGFIGGGAMAEALAGGLVAAGLAAAQISIAEPRAERRTLLAKRLGVVTHADNRPVVQASDLVVVAVKPNVVATALADLVASAQHDDALDVTRPLWVSIAAGVRLEALGATLGARARIVRAMPNTPALVQAGATAIVGNAPTTASDLDAAQVLFESVGSVWRAGREDHLDAVTGLSGSGPAYVFLFIEALIEAGEKVGLEPIAARSLALQTVFGAAKLALQSERSPAELREQVSSKGGTTVAGLAQLEAGGLRDLVARAVDAATQRSRELGESPDSAPSPPATSSPATSPPATSPPAKSRV